MAITEIYVDPSIDGNSGAGTVGDPYGDLQYALNTWPSAYDSTNGNRINIKAGTAEVMTAVLGFSTFFASASPSAATAPVVFEGYTTSAGDGGIGEVDMNGGAYGFITSTSYDYFGFKNLKMGNQGTHDNIIRLDNYIWMVNCHLYDAGNLFTCDNQVVIHRCKFTNGDLRGIYVASSASITNCYFENGASKKFTDAISANTNCRIMNNIFNLTGSANSSNAIVCAGFYGRVFGNSIYSNAGSGKGISASSNKGQFDVSNNLIDGFSAPGGIGIDLANIQYLWAYAGNAVYNCATAYNSTTVDYGAYVEDNETLSASPFNSASTSDFSPVDTGNVKGGWEPPDFGDALS